MVSTGLGYRPHMLSLSVSHYRRRKEPVNNCTPATLRMASFGLDKDHSSGPEAFICNLLNSLVPYKRHGSFLIYDLTVCIAVTWAEPLVTRPALVVLGGARHLGVVSDWEEQGTWGSCQGYCYRPNIKSLISKYNNTPLLECKSGKLVVNRNRT